MIHEKAAAMHRMASFWIRAFCFLAGRSSKLAPDSTAGALGGPLMDGGHQQYLL